MQQLDFYGTCGILDVTFTTVVMPCSKAFLCFTTACSCAAFSSVISSVSLWLPPPTSSLGCWGVKVSTFGEKKKSWVSNLEALPFHTTYQHNKKYWTFYRSDSDTDPVIWFTHSVSKAEQHHCLPAVTLFASMWDLWECQHEKEGCHSEEFSERVFCLNSALFCKLLLSIKAGKYYS